MNRRFFINAAVFMAVLGTCLSSCKDDNDIKVTAVTVKEAVYVNSPASMQITLKDNETLQLTPFIMPQDAANKALTYSNKYPELLSVSNEGLLTGKAVGKDTLTVSATDGSGVSTRYVVNIIDHKVKATAINVAAAGSNFEIKLGNTFNLGVHVSLSPADTWDKTVTYTSNDESVVTVDAAGIVTSVGIGATTITIKTIDGSNLSRDCNVTVRSLAQRDLVRSLWEAQTAAAIEGVAGGFDYVPAVISWVPDRYDSNKKVTGYPAHLFDENASTFLAMLKPGKPTYATGGSGWASYPEAKAELEAMGAPDTGASASVSSTAVNYFVVNMKSPQTFSYVRWTHRNGTRGLQAWAIDIYGSNDGTTWSAKLNGNTPLALDVATGDKRLPITNDQTEFTYQYIKVVIASFDTVNSSNVQVGEFGLGRME
ncbi:Ig-like domain-containing protein [Dysgonomonas reticulitermitis]